MIEVPLGVFVPMPVPTDVLLSCALFWGSSDERAPATHSPLG